MKTRSGFYFGKYILMGLAGLALFTYVVLLLWNWLIPELFNGPVLSFWQALGIMILSKILFTGVIGHGRRPSDERYDKQNCHVHFPHRDFWKKRFEEKMNRKAETENKDED